MMVLLTVPKQQHSLLFCKYFPFGMSASKTKLQKNKKKSHSLSFIKIHVKRYGAGSVVLAFFSKQGCYSRTEAKTQRLGDTEVPTESLRDLQKAITKLRNDVRTLPSDSSISISVDEAQRALSNVSFVQMPSSVGEEKRAM